MNKIILLDWDGPVSNSRTWQMPGCVDPVAIQLLNDLTMRGWKTVLTSTIRKNFRSEDPQEEASEFMRCQGFYVQWYDVWRTCPDLVTRRHIEVASFLQNNEVDEDTVFMVIDDEKFPTAFLKGGRMFQIYADSHAGLDYLNIGNAYRLMKMSDARLRTELAVVHEYSDEDDDGEAE